MTQREQFIALNLRRIYRRILSKSDTFESTSDHSDYFGQAASNLIRDGLASNLPFAVSRFGYSELRALLTYIHIQEDESNITKISNYIRGKKVEPWWHPNTIKIITHNAGVFPNNIEVIEAFCRLLLDDIPEIDVLGSWLGGEALVKSMMPNTKYMRFHDFYHFLHAEPWTVALKGKKVLVVHPFSKSIANQYKIKDKIFTGVHTLPDFELIAYQAVQSIAGNIPQGFSNWFQALDFMKSEISNIEFDVAILGCGAYGMPLAASIKSDMKKKAIHLGGNTQILFGIKGSRWESDPNFKSIFNPYWVKPRAEETPIGHNTIDSNCYW